MRRRLAAASFGALLVLGSVFVGVSPAQAGNTYYGCPAEGTYMFGRYPVNHDQEIFNCVWSPYFRYWEHSETCAAGTHPVATLTPTSLEGLYIAQTSCAAN